MTAPAGHVTVAAVPKLLPVPHAVDSSDDERERDGVALTDRVPRPAFEALIDGDGVAVWDDEREGVRDCESDGDELRLAVGDRPAWHCT